MGECFNCRNRKEKSPMEAEECLRGHTTYSVKSVKELSICSDFNPRVGFQIGGYWSHMWFTQENPGHIDACLKWNICSDGEFPTDKPAISFHICDFEQMEKFIDLKYALLMRVARVSLQKLYLSGYQAILIKKKLKIILMK